MKKICEHCIHNTCSYRTRCLENKCEKVQDYEQGYADAVEKAYEYLNIFYNEETHSYLIKEDIEQFIKAMEEEQ